ncbi:hypothetical protein Dda_8926 [Drechslerella dactyloides]|uniref:Peptidase M20 dimerisation domain-containing protein n=1 Tax=Drechslerella dactyloides TaxID=74499 RepID=A0AAD6IRW2_DREDA|nr:hypothetical protein Dda_8926 [Drechslerella dactyloides]
MLSIDEGRKIRDEVIRQCNEIRRRSVSRDNYQRNALSIRAYHRVEVVESFRNPNGFPIPHVLLDLTVSKFWKLRSQSQVETLFTLCRYYDIPIVHQEDRLEDFVGVDLHPGADKVFDTFQVIRADIPTFHRYIARELGLNYEALVAHIARLEAASKLSLRRLKRPGDSLESTRVLSVPACRPLPEIVIESVDDVSSFLTVALVSKNRISQVDSVARMIKALSLKDRRLQTHPQERRTLAPAYQNMFRALLLAGAVVLGYCLSYLHWPHTVPGSRFQPSSVHHRHRATQLKLKDLTELCPRVNAIFPNETTLDLESALGELKSSKYVSRLAGLLGEAVRTRTDVNDGAGAVGVDPLWQKMGNFKNWLSSSFPLIHKELLLESVNTYGVLYTWKGSDPSLKPIALVGHYDTVLVAPETIDTWKYPPFSGHLDGDGYLWGRGSADDKSQVVAILEAVEKLIQAGFRPKRTVIIAFGFDEELGGERGGRNLGLKLHERYGDNGIALVIDEGTAMITEFGTNFMAVSTAEKGIANHRITIRAPGGHSAIPPPHTGIGIMAELITEIEGHPYPIHLAEENPFYNLLACGAVYAKDFPKQLKDHLENGDREALAKDIARISRAFEAQVRTTLAVTRINGGVKVNALPESVTTETNYRIRMGSTSAEITKVTESLASKVAEKYGLQLFAYPETATYPPSSITLEFDFLREPAPVTSSRTDISSPYRLIAGTTRHVMGEDFVVIPSLNNGNTDTFWYWKVSNNIFRYAPMPSARENIHTVNERISMKAYVLMVEWFFTFIRNADETNFEG